MNKEKGSLSFYWLHWILLISWTSWSMMPLSNYLMPYFDINPHQFSLLVGSYSLSAFVAGILLALFVDRFDRKRVLLLVYIRVSSRHYRLRSGAYLWLTDGGKGCCRIFWWYHRGTGVFDHRWYFSYERRGMAVGSVMAAFAVASIVGVPVSLYMANFFGFNWHVPFLIVGGVGVVLIPMITKVLPPMKEHIAEKTGAESRFEALLKVFKNPH